MYITNSPSLVASITFHTQQCGGLSGFSICISILNSHFLSRGVNWSLPAVLIRLFLCIPITHNESSGMKRWESPLIISPQGKPRLHLDPNVRDEHLPDRHLPDQRLPDERLPDQHPPAFHQPVRQRILRKLNSQSSFYKRGKLYMFPNCWYLVSGHSWFHCKTRFLRFILLNLIRIGQSQGGNNRKLGSW